MKTNPNCQSERSDILQETGHLAVCAGEWGKNGQLELGGPPERPLGMTPDDTVHGRQRETLIRRERIKRLTLERRNDENLHNTD